MIITMSGSLRFQKQMVPISEQLTLLGHCVLMPIFKPHENKVYTDEQIRIFEEAHIQRINISEALFVVNIDDYIGESTRKEIEYAKKLGKQIMYYSQMKDKIKY